VIKVVVTGACGFIGSAITEKLISQGYFVEGIDNLDNNLYSKEVKEKRLSNLLNLDNFSFSNLDLATDNLDQSIEGSTYVINEAALPGQVLSWEIFPKYVSANILAVEKLLEKCLKYKVKKVVQASTSSVCGKFAVGNEAIPTNPISPYGITKLAAENLYYALGLNSDLNFAILRYFSVYGPGQRPDMAIHKFLKLIKSKSELNITGDGTQKRDLTFISDVVDVTISSMKFEESGQIFNISGGKQYSLNEIVNKCFDVVGNKTNINYVKRPKGDQEETFGDNSKARLKLGFDPKVDLIIGLQKQLSSMANE
jgi:nucleoside-diphosphate-sugar epimerase